MTGNKVWRNLFQNRLYVSTYGECVVTVQPLATNDDMLSDIEMQSTEFYVVKPSDSLEYTVYFDEEHEVTSDAWTFVALAHKLIAVSDVASKGTFDEEHPLNISNLIVAPDNRIKARFDFALTMEDYGLDTATYINDLTSAVMSYSGCRGVYTKELVESKGILPLDATLVDLCYYRHKLDVYIHKGLLNFSAKSVYKVMNIQNCTVTEYKSNSLYQLIRDAGGDYAEFLLYGATAHYVWLDVDRTLVHQILRS